MKIDLYDDNIGYVTNSVSNIDISKANRSEDNRMKFVTDLAAISRGKSESNNPKLRYKQLLTEGANETPSRPLEFLPIIVDLNILTNTISLCNQVFDLVKFNNLIGRYSYITNENGKYKLYTNMRTLIKAGIEYKHIPYNDNIDNFVAIRARLPMFVWSQFMTHTQLSKESQSDRVSSTDLYWLPSDLVERCKNYIQPTDEEINMYMQVGLRSITMAITQISLMNIRNEIVNLLIDSNLNQTQVQVLFKLLGYKKEIYQRAPYYFKYKEFVLTGWNIDPYSWKNLFLERGADDSWKNWVQKETKEAAIAIKKLIQ